MDNMKPLEVIGVKFWDSDEEKFHDMDFNVQFSKTKIKLFIPSLHFETEIELPSDKIIPVSVKKKDDINTIVYIANVIFLMSYNQSIRVEKFFKALNEPIEKKIEEIDNKVNDVCDALDNEVYNMATNVIKLVDQSILLNHDAVILLQRLNSLNKIDNIEFYNIDILDDDEFTYYVNSLYEAIVNFADLLEEENIIQSEYKNSVAWELVKRVSIPYYSDVWKSSYEKYLDKPLQINFNSDAEPDGTLDRYIEEVILCNEINHNSDEVLAYFTYYMMKQGYAIGTQYFPAYFNICKKAFSVIEENLRKILFKNRLKSNVENKETHLSIDDIDIMNGCEFESFICDMLSKMGYNSEVTKQTGDQGLDVIAKRNNIKIGIQAKCYSNTVGNSAIQEAVAGKNYYKCDKVIVVSNNFFTNSATELAQVNNVILWDRNILKEKILELY